MNNLAYVNGHYHHEMNGLQDEFRKFMIFKKFLFKYVYSQGIIINELINMLNMDESFQAEVDMERLVIKVKVKKTVVRKIHGNTYTHNSTFYSGIVNHYMNSAFTNNLLIVNNALLANIAEYPELSNNYMLNMSSMFISQLFNVVVQLDNIFEIRL